MQETLRHQEAFEHYYGLGEKRSLTQVAEKFDVTVQAVGKWSVAHNWQDKVIKRDKENAIKLAKQTDRQILKSKSDLRKEIQDSLQIIRVLMATAVQPIRTGDIKATNVTDVTKLARAQDTLVRCEQLLAGEADSREEHIVVFEDIEPQKGKYVESEVINNDDN